MTLAVVDLQKLFIESVTQLKTETLYRANYENSCKNQLEKFPR